MINSKLLGEVLGREVKDGTGRIVINDNLVTFAYEGEDMWSDINIYELAFNKCVEWIWEQGYDTNMFRANNIYHVRLWGKNVEDKRFYSNPHNKHDAVFQACEWILKENK